MLYRIKLRQFEVVSTEVEVLVEADDSDEAIFEAETGNGEVISVKELDRDTEHTEVLDCESEEE